jgi:ribosomal protein S18 acetylase RimI-like enzyme
MMAGDHPEGSAAMELRLQQFSGDAASVVSGWATTPEEVLMWCGHPVAPVPAEQINAWADEDWVHAFGLYRDERLVAYGEMWIDDDEAGVELARLIVDPADRGQGLGRRLASDLADRARFWYPLVFLRVHPDNIAAQRCYAATGFEPVDAHQATAWNEHQPVSYVWLRLPS